MAEIGAIANVTGVVGFICQGCVFLKDLIGDIKDAPKEVQSLRNELDIIQGVVDSHGPSNQSNSGSVGTADPVLQACLEAITAVGEDIAPALKAFNDRSSKGKTIKRNWHRVMIALGKKHTKEKLERLSRAKDTLVAAQTKLSLAFASDQTPKIYELGVSVSRIDANTKESIAGSSKILDGVTQNQEGIAALQFDSATSLGLLRSTALSCGESVSGIQRVEDGVAMLKSELGDSRTRISAFRTQFSATATDIQDRIDSVPAILKDQMRAERQELRSERDQQTEALLGRIVTSAVNDALEKHRCSNIGHVEHTVMQADQGDMQLDEPNHEPTRNYHSMVRGRTRFRSTAYDFYNYPLLKIWIETFEPTKGSGSSRRVNRVVSVGTLEECSYTTVRLIVRTGVFNRMFEFKRVHHTHGSFLAPNIRTYNVVSNNSAILKAVCDADITKMKYLFENRQASPFDVDPSGDSILSCCIARLFKLTDKNVHLQNLSNMIKLLLKFDLPSPEQLGYSIVNFAFSHPIFTKEHDDIVRLSLQSCAESPFDHWPKAWFITLDSAKSGFGGFLLNQECFLADWSEITWEDGRVVESNWQILNDPDGKSLRQTLETCSGKDTIQYEVIMDEGTYWDNPFFKLLTIICNNRTHGELVKACLNRIALLVKHGWDPQSWVHEPWGGEMTISQDALATNTFEVWEEALRLADWHKFDIMGLFDESLYLGIPELFAGAVYMTQEESVEEFRELLITGHYSYLASPDYSDCTYLTWRERSDLIEMSQKVFSRRNLPGAWQDEKVEGRIQPGEDSEFDELMREIDIPWGIDTKNETDREISDCSDEEESDSEEELDTDDSDESEGGSDNIKDINMDVDEFEYSLLQTNDDTDSSRGFERSSEWLFQSYKVL